METKGSKQDTPRPPRVTVSKLRKDSRAINFPNSDAFELPADSVRTLTSKRSSPTFNRVKEQSVLNGQVVRGKKLSLADEPKK